MSIRSLLSLYYRRLRRAREFYQRETILLEFFPRGHHYSPLPDVAAGAKHAADECRRPREQGMTGIDLRAEVQEEILRKIIGFYPEFDWNEESMPQRRFHLRQGWYNRADSICLYSMLRLFRPKRVIEVGSGFSSALMLDVNDRFLDGKTQFTFIDPEPSRLEQTLSRQDRFLVRIVAEPVQTVTLDVFEALQAGDFLFIDSSHVSRAGSDVNFLFFEVLPRLPAGVLVHVHDVFWPFNYPAEWIAGGRAWNEAYLARAFLSFNNSFEVVFWAPFIAGMCPEIIEERMPGSMLQTGSSLWFRRGMTP